MDLPSLYTPSQVADYLHVSRGTIYSLISRGQIKSVKVGRKRRFTSAHIKEYLNRYPQEVIVSDNLLDSKFKSNWRKQENHLA